MELNPKDHFNALLHEMKDLNRIRADHPDKLTTALTLLTGEINRVWDGMSKNSDEEDEDDGFIEQRPVVLSERVAIPESPASDRRGRSNYLIGRLLGHSGNSLRQLEAETACKVAIRGQGSVRDADREQKLRGQPGWEHLQESLHVYITAKDHNRKKCQTRLHEAVAKVKNLLETGDDAFKKKQLGQLAAGGTEGTDAASKKKKL